MRPEYRGGLAGHWPALWRSPDAVESRHRIPKHLPAPPTRYFPHTSASCPRTCAPGRFRGVDDTHVPAAAPASPRRRVPCRRSPEAVHGPNPFGRRPIRRIGFPNAMHRVWGPFPTEGVSIGGFAFLFPASSACARSLSSFRARVILLSDGPTRPIPRLPMRGTVPPFLPPEPPLLPSASGWAPFCVGTHAGCHARAFWARYCRVRPGRATILTRREFGPEISMVSPEFS